MAGGGKGRGSTPVVPKAKGRAKAGVVAAPADAEQPAPTPEAIVVSEEAEAEQPVPTPEATVVSEEAEAEQPAPTPEATMVSDSDQEDVPIPHTLFPEIFCVAEFDGKRRRIMVSMDELGSPSRELPDEPPAAHADDDEADEISDTEELTEEAKIEANAMREVWL